MCVRERERERKVPCGRALRAHCVYNPQVFVTGITVAFTGSIPSDHLELLGRANLEVRVCVGVCECGRVYVCMCVCVRFLEIRTLSYDFSLSLSPSLSLSLFSSQSLLHFPIIAPNMERTSEVSLAVGLRDNGICSHGVAYAAMFAM